MAWGPHGNSIETVWEWHGDHMGTALRQSGNGMGTVKGQNGNRANCSTHSYCITEHSAPRLVYTQTHVHQPRLPDVSCPLVLQVMERVLTCWVLKGYLDLSHGETMPNTNLQLQCEFTRPHDDIIQMMTSYSYR